MKNMSKNKIIFHTVQMDKAERTPQGFLKMPAYLTRTGVFKYMNKDGTVSRQLRHPEDVFKPESIETLRGVPFTNEHPKGLVEPSNLKKNVVGWVGDAIEIDSIYLKGIVTVADAEAIDDVESGKKEVSCGYTADVIEEKGFYNGEEYNCRQTNIVYNHVSLVKKGRAGSNVKLHLDSDQMQMIDEQTNPSKEDSVAKIKLGDIDYEVSAEVADAFNSEMKKKNEAMDALNKKMADMMPKAEMDKMAAKCDSLEAEVKDLKLKKDSAEINQEEIAKQVKARVALISQAQKFVKAETKLDEMTDLEIKKAAITEKRPALKLDGKSEDYVNAAYELLLDESAEDKKNQEKLNEKTKTTTTTDGEESKPLSSVEARKKAIADSMGAWKTKSEFGKEA